ncbi:alpha/beta fold hydrolase [Rhodobacteraceae bacterium LMO-12]|nr:alpha/beta fold hydrolase [Rhodobacteraceae bacterium LMO-JJ12]
MRYRFANCVLDTDRRGLLRDGEAVSVEPQVFDLLELLAQNAGAMVSKDQLIEVVWGGRIVSEATISARINAARRAVGDTGKAQAVIRTVPRRGFEMVAAVIAEGSGAGPAPQAASDIPQTIRYTTSKDGTSIAYGVSGSGPPLMRAGHFLTHLEVDWRQSVFRPFLQTLSRAHRLVRYDMRGMGLSQPDAEELTIERYIEDMLAVADKAGLERFPILGISQGVPIAVKFAAEFPERVSRLVLYGGFAQGRALRDGGMRVEEAEAMKAMIRAGWGKPGSAFVSAFTAVFCPDATKAERDSLVETQQASATPEMALKIRTALDHLDVSDALAKIVAPTLVVHASNDAVNPMSQARFLAAHIAGAELRVLESNNHLFVPSCPATDELLAVCLEFLGRDLDQ